MKTLVYTGRLKGADLVLGVRKYTFERGVPLGIPDEVVNTNPEIIPYNPELHFDPGKPGLIVMPGAPVELLAAQTVVARILDTHPTKEFHVLATRPEWHFLLTNPRCKPMISFTPTYMQFSHEYRIQLPKDVNRILVNRPGGDGYTLEYRYLRVLKLGTEHVEPQIPTLWGWGARKKKGQAALIGTAWPALTGALKSAIPALKSLEGLVPQARHEELKSTRLLISINDEATAHMAAYLGVDVFLFTNSRDDLAFRQIALFNGHRPTAVRYSPIDQAIPLEKITDRIGALIRGETAPAAPVRKQIAIPAVEEAPAEPRHRYSRSTDSPDQA